MHSPEASGSTVYAPRHAGISTLSQALESWMDASDTVKVEESRTEPGDCRYVFSGPGARTAFELVLVGFLRLQATAPQKIHVAEKIF